MALIQDPVLAIIVSFVFLGIMLYRRVNLGITLTATALFLALIGLDWSTIPTLIYQTTDYSTPEGRLAISVVLATFGIMLISQLYKETKLINRLSESLSKIFNNPKIVIGILPAVLGFLPVAGGALMSAPLVDAEARKLGLQHEKKAYLNLWFRHTIFPIYPLSQVLIVVVGLTGVTMATLIARQIPVVIVMIIVGYFIGFWKLPRTKNEQATDKRIELNSELKAFLVAFLPILIMIIVAVALDLVNVDLAKQGFDLLIAILVGLIVLVMIAKPSFSVFAVPFRSFSIYGITLAAYGAFLLRKALIETGISRIFVTVTANGGIDVTLLLIIVPAALGMLTASALGGVSISIPILQGVVALSPQTASLIYMSGYLGYVVAPTHLCLAFTADYFSCSLRKMYKYVIPSVMITFATVLLIYFLI